MSAKVPFSIFQYSSHLEFLQDAYDYLHSQNETFSFDHIAERCGLKSRTLARNLIKGIQKPNESQLSALGSLFSLDSDEQKYLICLFKFYDAGSSPASFELFQQLMTLQKQKLPNQNPFREIEITASVLHMTVLSVLELPNSPHEPIEICSLLKNRYTPEQIATALGELLTHGFIEKTDGSAGYLLKQKHIKKYDYHSNFFLKRFHHECLKVAGESLENENPSERYLVGASFCINEKVFPRIVQKMNAFVENLMQLEGVAGGPDTVVQFNQQLIKMTSGHAKSERGLGGSTAERGFDQTKNPVIV